MRRIMCVVLVGCAALAGCSSKSEVRATTTTTGQELRDLEQARADGLLTEKEYQRERKQIMDRK